MLLSLLLALVLERKFKDVLMVIVASCLVLFAEYVALPFERNNHISDGLGLPLLSLGWFILFCVMDKSRHDIKSSVVISSQYNKIRMCEDIGIV
jgi:hypothetical protein